MDICIYKPTSPAKFGWTYGSSEGTLGLKLQK